MGAARLKAAGREGERAAIRLKVRRYVFPLLETWWALIGGPKTSRDTKKDCGKPRAARITMKKANVKNLLSKMHDDSVVERVATGIYRMPNPQSELDIGGGVI
jgi:hypothetical protein